MGLLTPIGIIFWKEVLMELLELVLIGLVIAGYLVFINLLVNAAKEKGARDMGGRMWLVGLTLTPIALALYVIVLPDRRGSARTYSSDALPEL